MSPASLRRSKQGGCFPESSSQGAEQDRGGEWALQSQGEAPAVSQPGSAVSCGVLAFVLPLWLWERGAEPLSSVWPQGCTAPALPGCGMWRCQAGMSGQCPPAFWGLVLCPFWASCVCPLVRGWDTKAVCVCTGLRRTKWKKTPFYAAGKCHRAHFGRMFSLLLFNETR